MTLDETMGLTVVEDNGVLLFRTNVNTAPTKVAVTICASVLVMTLLDVEMHDDTDETTDLEARFDTVFNVNSSCSVDNGAEVLLLLFSTDDSATSTAVFVDVVDDDEGTATSPVAPSVLSATVVDAKTPTAALDDDDGDDDNGLLRNDHADTEGMRQDEDQMHKQ